MKNKKAVIGSIAGSTVVMILLILDLVWKLSAGTVFSEMPRGRQINIIASILLLGIMAALLIGTVVSAVTKRNK